MALTGRLHIGTLTRLEVVQHDTSIWIEVTERDEFVGTPLSAVSAREFEALAEAATQAAELMRRRDEAPGLEADRLEPHRVGACDNRARGQAS